MGIFRKKTQEEIDREDCLSLMKTVEKSYSSLLNERKKTSDSEGFVEKVLRDNGTYAAQETVKVLKQHLEEQSNQCRLRLSGSTAPSCYLREQYRRRQSEIEVFKQYLEGYREIQHKTFREMFMYQWINHNPIKTVKALYGAAKAEKRLKKVTLDKLMEIRRGY